MNREEPRIIDPTSTHWESHPHFPGIKMKKLVTPVDNPFASCHLVYIPPGGEVIWHEHPMQMEIVHILKGQSLLTVNQIEQPLNVGYIASIPNGTFHSLRNTGSEPVELMAILILSPVNLPSTPVDPS
jgi:quercetin dioxygenase-like cupin family protein